MTLYCQDDLANHIAVMIFNVDGFDAGNTGTMLDVDHNIACRTGLHCAPRVHEQLGLDTITGAVRFGIGPFNTDEHISTAIGAVREIAAARGEEGALSGTRRTGRHAHRRAERQTLQRGRQRLPPGSQIWDNEVARDFATTEGITEMTDEHWKLVRYLREYYLKFGIAPMVRKLCKETGFKLALSVRAVSVGAGERCLQGGRAAQADRLRLTARSPSLS